MLMKCLVCGVVLHHVSAPKWGLYLVYSSLSVGRQYAFCSNACCAKKPGMGYVKLFATKREAETEKRELLKRFPALKRAKED